MNPNIYYKYNTVVVSVTKQLCFNSLLVLIAKLHGPQREKTCLRGFSNNTGADQPAHTRSLISAFVFRFLERIISRLAMSEISIF